MVSPKNSLRKDELVKCVLWTPHKRPSEHVDTYDNLYDVYSNTYNNECEPLVNPLKYIMAIYELFHNV